MKISKEILNAFEISVRETVRYLNNGGAKLEGVFSSNDSRYECFNEYSDFGDSQEISKRLSPIFERCISIEGDKYLVNESIERVDAKGYDFIINNKIKIELKITTASENKEIDMWTLNKTATNKVPIHLLLCYKTRGKHITSIGLYLTDISKKYKTMLWSSHDCKTSSYANIKILKSAIDNSEFLPLIGNLRPKRIYAAAKMEDVNEFFIN